MKTGRDDPDYGNLDSLFPEGTPRYMTPAWLSFIMFSLRDEQAIEAFRKESGNNWKPNGIPIEMMVDDATGADWNFLKGFVLWLNKWYWGRMDDKTA